MVGYDCSYTEPISWPCVVVLIVQDAAVTIAGLTVRQTANSAEARYGV